MWKRVKRARMLPADKINGKTKSGDKCKAVTLPEERGKPAESWACQ